MSSKQATCAHPLNLYLPRAASPPAISTRYYIFNNVGARNEIMRIGSATLADPSSLRSARALLPCTCGFGMMADQRRLPQTQIPLTLELISIPFPPMYYSKAHFFSSHALVIWLNNSGLHSLNRTPVRGSMLCP